MSKLKDKTVFITGASRGIGKAIALRAAEDGANIVIAAKTAEPHPKLEGTIFTSAKDVEKAGGKALPLVVDVRFEEQVEEAMAKTVETFGGIDILVNNASAISLSGTEYTAMKSYDLMHQINTRGTFLCSQKAIPHLKKADNPHVLNLSPPLNMSANWFKMHVAYTMAKYGMSMCVLGMSEEFRGKIAFNALWPRTAIATAAIANTMGGEQSFKLCRKPDIMSDAAYEILTSDYKTCTGNFFIDEALLREKGVSNFRPYQCDPAIEEERLLPDLYVEEQDLASS